MADKTRFQDAGSPGEFKITDDGQPPLERCGTCCYWGRMDGGGTCCRKNPPISLPLMGPQGLQGLVALFPPVREHDWCGQWRSGLEADA